MFQEMTDLNLFYIIKVHLKVETKSNALRTY